MLKQVITLELSGKGDALDPESFALAVENLVALLKAVDAKMWPVSTPRYRWRIVAVGMHSPLRLTIEASKAIDEAPDADVVGSTMSGLTALESDKTRLPPRYFDSLALGFAKKFVGVYRGSVMTLAIEAPGRVTVRPSLCVAAAVDVLSEQQKAIPYEKYGSVGGVLRRVTLDERQDHEASDLQLIDIDSGQLIECRLNPQQARKLGAFIGRRVVLYGAVRFNAQRLPQKISVEEYRVIKEKLPTLEDLHAAKIDITGGEDAADFIAHLRGDGE